MNLTARQRAKGLRNMKNENLSPSARVRKRFKTGRPPKLADLSPEAAVAKISAGLAELRAMHNGEGLKPEDARAGIVWFDGKLARYNFFDTLEAPSEILAKILESEGIALGCLYEQEDPDKGRIVWAYAFGADEATLRTMQVVKRRYLEDRAMEQGLKN